MKSFVPVEPDSHFPIQNLPYGVGRPVAGGEPRVLSRIGDLAVDLAELERAGRLPGDVFSEPALNRFLSLGRPAWTAARAALSRLLSADEPPSVRSDRPLGHLRTFSPVEAGRR